jgi:hypothetical protein
MYVGFYFELKKDSCKNEITKKAIELKVISKKDSTDFNFVIETLFDIMSNYIIYDDNKKDTVIFNNFCDYFDVVTDDSIDIKKDYDGRLDF